VTPRDQWGPFGQSKQNEIETVKFQNPVGGQILDNYDNGDIWSDGDITPREQWGQAPWSQSKGNGNQIAKFQHPARVLRAINSTEPVAKVDNSPIIMPIPPSKDRNTGKKNCYNSNNSVLNNNIGSSDDEDGELTPRGPGIGNEIVKFHHQGRVLRVDSTAPVTKLDLQNLSAPRAPAEDEDLTPRDQCGTREEEVKESAR